MFLPDNIDLRLADKYVLSLRISPQKFAYSIHEPKVGGKFWYRETAISEDAELLNEVQQIIFDSNFLTQKFKYTNVMFVSDEYEVVPKYLIEKDEVNALYNFSHEVVDYQVVQSAKLIQNNFILFGINKELYKFLVRSLFSPHFFHHSQFILEHANNKRSGLTEKAKMFLNFHDSFVDIICYDAGGKLQHAISLYNANEYNQIYYILNLWNKCNFDQKKDCMYILKSLDETGTSSTAKILREYVQNIEIIGEPNEVNFLNLEENICVPLDLLILSVL